MERLSDRKLTKVRQSKEEVRRLGFIAFLVATGWLAAASGSNAAVEAVGARDAPSQTAPPVNASASAQPYDVTIAAAIPPTEEELAGDSLSQFVAHHATVHYFDTGVTGSLARWRGGKQSICPLTMGLNPEQDAYVTARLRALATYVGAPVDTDPQCKNDVKILFTNNPAKQMDDVVKWATVYFRNRYLGGGKDLIAFRSGHAIEGWYLTTSGAVLNTDVEFQALSVLPIWPQITQQYSPGAATGTHLGSNGAGSGIGVVILVVDTTKVVGYSIGAIADYVAMLTLSVAQSPDHCDPLPSILDLMSSSCATRASPTAITAGDLAFLKALYYKNTGLGRSLSRSQIQDNMTRQFSFGSFDALGAAGAPRAAASPHQGACRTARCSPPRSRVVVLSSTENTTSLPESRLKNLTSDSGSSVISLSPL